MARVANDLRRVRHDRGLTQEELARRCGVSRQTINSIERDAHEPTLALALRLAAELDHPLSSLFTLKATP